MAAVSVADMPRVVHLRELRGAPLTELLSEEVEAWRRELDWNFQPSADLVLRYTGMHALNGFALLYGNTVAGYTYSVTEESKGLVGDLYVRQSLRTAEAESLLLGAAVEALMKAPSIRRIECQLMMMTALDCNQAPDQRHLRYFSRNFMMAGLSNAEDLRPGRAAGQCVFERWQERRQDESAALITSSYQGHIDADINDQYRSTSGARRFLHNIIQYPGCGTFCPGCSWVAIDPENGRMCGICLTSLVALNSGHITQVCVAPAYQGKGIGYELMRRSLLDLKQEGATTVSLTVTTANSGAVELYEKMGFRTRHEFPACVWEGF